MWKFLAVLLVSLSLLPGCGLGVLAAGIGYAVSSSKSSDAEMAKAEADLQKGYTDYKLGMERINMEREKNKLRPQPIMTLGEWLNNQALPENVRKDLAEKKVLPQQEPKPEAQTPKDSQSKPE